MRDVRSLVGRRAERVPGLWCGHGRGDSRRVLYLRAAESVRGSRQAGMGRAGHSFSGSAVRHMATKVYASRAVLVIEQARSAWEQTTP